MYMKKEVDMRFTKYIIILLVGIGLFNGMQGQVWGPDTRLSFNDSLSYFGFPTQWSIAADSVGGVHVVWYDQRDPQWCSEVYYKRSTDNGSSWEVDMPLTTNSSHWQESPCIVADNMERLHVVYTEYFIGGSLNNTIHYKRSIDGGNTWEPQDDIIMVMGDFAQHTSLATDLQDGVYVVFTNQTGAGWMQIDHYFIRSTNGGATWGSSVRLTYSQTALWGSVAADTLGRVHVVYVEAPAGQRQVFYRRSTNMGQSFESSVQLTSGSSNKSNSCIYTDRGNNIHVVWEDSRDGGWETYYIHSTDGGTTWGAEIRLSDTLNNSEQANITCDLKNGVYVVWADDRDNSDYEVYFKGSSDGGNTWSDDTCLTNGAVAHYDCLFPNIACTDSGDYLHVAWQDERDGNLEVYYKKRTTGSAIAEGTAIISNSERINIFPNPFSKTTEISFGKGQSAECTAQRIELKIYDVTGRLVKDFYCSTPYALRPTRIIWDGTDNLGHKVPGGVYLVRLVADPVGKTVNYKETKKVIFLQ